LQEKIQKSGIQGRIATRLAEEERPYCGISQFMRRMILLDKILASAAQDGIMAGVGVLMNVG
jgi:hypothetical protein